MAYPKSGTHNLRPRTHLMDVTQDPKGGTRDPEPLLYVEPETWNPYYTWNPESGTWDPFDREAQDQNNDLLLNLEPKSYDPNEP